MYIVWLMFIFIASSFDYMPMAGGRRSADQLVAIKVIYYLNWKLILAEIQILKWRVLSSYLVLT